MKILLLCAVCVLALAACQTADRSTRRRQPGQISSEVDGQPQRIAPTSL